MSPVAETIGRPYNDPIVIDNIHVFPGEWGLAKINVGRLPSNTTIEIEAQIYRAKNPGPTVLLIGGIHGDEINGVEIVRRFIEQELSGHLVRGSIIAIPLLNVYGFINFSREVPDGKDVNRSFPGSSTGSLASRVARTLTKKILPYVDLALDFHTGGASRYNYPQTRFNKADDKARHIAELFNAPYTIEKGILPKTFRKTAKELNIPAVVYEGGESIRLDGFSIESAICGIKKVMVGLEMFEPIQSLVERKSIEIVKTFWIRASFSGIFIWSKSSGHYVRKGEPLGTIKDPFGSRSITVISKLAGHIIGHNNASVVNQGDALFHIGIEKA
jgi:predicted deacylase